MNNPISQDMSPLEKSTFNPAHRLSISIAQSNLFNSCSIVFLNSKRGFSSPAEIISLVRPFYDNESEPHMPLGSMKLQIAGCEVVQMDIAHTLQELPPGNQTHCILVLILTRIIKIQTTFLLRHGQRPFPLYFILSDLHFLLSSLT